MMRTTFLTVCTAFVAIFGCTTAHMPLPDELAADERLTVSGRQGLKIREKLTFGAYDVVDIRRSWVSGRDLQVLGYEGNKREQRFTLVLREEGSDRFGASCEAKLAVRTVHTDVVDLSLRDKTTLFCSIYPSGIAATDWELHLTGFEDGRATGPLEIGGRQYLIEGSRKLEGGFSAESTTGYTIRKNARHAAAIETIGDGMVVLSNSLDDHERGLMATAAAVFLSLEDLHAHVSGNEN